MPKRIQRKRTRGWRAPEGTLYVGRGTRYGNPWAVTLDRTRGWRVHPADDTSVLSPNIVGWWESRHRAHEVAVEKFREYAESTVGYAARARAELAGHDLMCWCPETLPCHVDVLLEVANQ
ncbi:DUF4326 domain-containing protein [Streptomyces sp. NPDC048288]|uniref:DUF4326 domain-containing protein n=1 Tax=Streptomyces sp. NPDC048288 TaxID=3365529 RepID=UPI0037129FA2